MAPAGHVGTIKSFNPKTGYGFVESPETFEIYGKDILFLKSEMPPNACQGQKVRFIVVSTDRGPQATEMRIAGPPISQWASFPASKQRMPDGPGKPFYGVVKSFNPQKGWGLIDCRETFDIYGKDMFVLKTALPNNHADAGTSVSFQVRQGEKGPEATNVQVVGPAWGASFQPRMQMQMPMQMQMQMQHMVQPRRHVPEGMVFHGVIKSYSESKGWGFITAKENFTYVGKEDVFFLRSEMPEGEPLTADARVQFQIRRSKGGRIEATQLKLLPDFAEFGDTLFQGTIKSFNEKKGWGFIASEHAYELFSKDIFLHQHELEGQVPEPGTVVQFSVKLSDQSGRPEATNVTLSGAMAEVVEFAKAERPKGNKGSYRVQPY